MQTNYLFMRLAGTILLCFLLLQARAQPVIPRFETLGVNEGLSQSSVYAIYQDRAGYMWFGTADGLNRYDGVEVRAFRCREDLRAPGNSNYVRGKLMEDEAANLWYCNETGIYRFNRRQEVLELIHRFTLQHYGNTIFTGLHLRAGRLWMINFSFGVFSFDIRNGKLESFPFPPTMPVHTRDNSNGIVMPNGDLLFSLFTKKGYVRFDAATHRFRAEETDKIIGVVCAGRQKSFLVSVGGIYIYDSVSHSTRFLECRIGGQPVENIVHVLEDPFGRLWLTTTGSGLLLYEPSSRSFRQFRHDNTRQRSLPIDLLRESFVDRNLNLWIGTDGGGVSRLDLKPPQFNLFPLNEGDYPSLKDYFTKCFYEDRQGRVWFGTHNNAFSIFDPAAGSLRTFSHDPADPRSIGGNIVGAITEDRQGKIWLGHSMGLTRVDPATFRMENFRPAPLPPVDPLNIYVYQLRQLRDGRLLAATQFGLATITTGARPAVRTFREAHLSMQCTSVLETAPGEIWYACPLNGLYRAFSAADSFVATERLFPGIDLRCLHQDEKDPRYLWIGSSKGLIRLDRQTRKYLVYTTTQGMANAYVYGILEDERHNFWLSTNGGLIFFDRQRQAFINYTQADGLQSNEFNTNAYFKGRSGNFFFGGVRGFNWFQPSTFITGRTQQRPLVDIAEVTVNERPLRVLFPEGISGTVRLPHQNNTLAFRFAALDFTRPLANKLQYRLEGWDPDWVTTTNRTVRYASLPPGSYRLRVRTLSPEGLASPLQELPFVIEAPYWKRTWFYLLVGLLLLSTAVLITRALAQRNFRRRLEALERERAVEAERNRISKDMHDEIGSGLTQIALLSELIQAQQKAEEEMKRDVATISAQARKLVKNMGEIIWTLNPQNDSLENLLAYMREQAQEYFEPFDIDFRIDFPLHPPVLKLSNEQRRNLFLVVKEALHNALKHAGASAIGLRLETSPRSLKFTVHDNGHGLGSKIRVGANGLRNMEKRMLDIGGAFTIQSGAAGTTASFVLPLPLGDRKAPLKQMNRES